MVLFCLLLLWQVCTMMCHVLIYCRAEVTWNSFNYFFLFWRGSLMSCPGELHNMKSNLESAHHLLIKYPHLFFCLLTDWVLWWFGLAWIWNRMCCKHTHKHNRHNRHTECSTLKTEANATSTDLCNYIRIMKERCLWWIQFSSGFDFVAFWMHDLCSINKKFDIFSFVIKCSAFLGLIKLEPHRKCSCHIF